MEYPPFLFLEVKSPLPFLLPFRMIALDRMMKSKVVLIGALVIGALVLGAGLVGYRLMVAALDEAAVTATQSCLGSVAAAIEETGGMDFIEVTQSDEWQTVSRAQMKQFLQSVGGALDCRKCADGAVCDAWGRPLVITWKRADDGVWIKVSSAGRDGISASKDDVFVEVFLKKR